MSYIVNIKNTLNRNFNEGASYVGEHLFKFDKSDDDKISLLKVSRAFSKNLLGRTVPINYSQEHDESYTDGKRIVISSHIDFDSLDSTIGLVLHESSHIAITNFDTWHSTPEKLKERNIDKKYSGVAFNLLNWIEDRRIDNWAYNKAPGYVKYYEALYYRYFLPEKTDKAIKELHKRDIQVTLNNYMFFIINFINDNVRRDELPDLQLIYDLIDIDNIERLDDTLQCQEIALDVLEIIIKNIQEAKDNSDGEGSGCESDEKGDEDKCDCKGKKNKGKSSGSGNTEVGDGESDGEEEDGDGNGEDFEKEIEDMSDEELDDLVNEIINNHQRLSENKPSDGDKIVPIPEKLAKKLEEKILGLDIEDIINNNEREAKRPDANESKYRIPSRSYNGGLTSSVVEVIDKINKNYITGGLGAVFSEEKYTPSVEGLQIGKRMAKLLAKKLKLRDEVRETKLIRQKKGHIDRRTIYTGGYTKDEMFYNSVITKHDKTNIHFSVDVSGSMGGDVWKETITLLSSLAYSFTEISNVRLQISFRTDSGGIKVFVFYDSDIDKKSKLELLKHVRPCGGTPEGLCYMALNKKLLIPLMNKNTIFVNISDGLPNSNAIIPTKEAIKLYQSLGMEVISFLVMDKRYDDQSQEFNRTFGSIFGTMAPSGEVFEQFREMYGDKNSFQIGSDELNKISNIINKKLLNIKK